MQYSIIQYNTKAWEIQIDRHTEKERKHNNVNCVTHRKLIIHPPDLNDTQLNSYSVPFDPLEIGPELTMDNPFDNPFDSSQPS